MKSNTYSNILIIFSTVLVLMIVMCSASEVSSESQNVSSIGTTTPSFTSDLSEGKSISLIGK
jgi:hypothetical protein